MSELALSSPGIDHNADQGIRKTHDQLTITENENSTKSLCPMSQLIEAPDVHVTSSLNELAPAGHIYRGIIDQGKIDPGINDSGKIDSSKIDSIKTDSCTINSSNVQPESIDPRLKRTQSNRKTKGMRGRGRRRFSNSRKNNSTFISHETPKIESIPSHAYASVVNYPAHPESQLEKVLPPTMVRNLKTRIYPTLKRNAHSAPVLDANRNHFYVWEYNIGNHTVTWDYQTGFVHLTELWKAAIQDGYYPRDGSCKADIKPNAKADIVKLLESTPYPLHSQIKRVRGGYLRIQGTWVPFELCKRLARKFCWFIRYELAIIFGPTFPSLCIPPSNPQFGELTYYGDTGPSPSETLYTVSHPTLPTLQPSFNNNYEYYTSPGMGSLFEICCGQLASVTNSANNTNAIDQFDNSPRSIADYVIEQVSLVPRSEAGTSAESSSLSGFSFTSTPSSSSPLLKKETASFRVNSTHPLSPELVKAEPPNTPLTKIPGTESYIRGAPMKRCNSMPLYTQEMIEASECLQLLSRGIVPNKKKQDS